MHSISVGYRCLKALCACAPQVCGQPSRAAPYSGRWREGALSDHHYRLATLQGRCAPAARSGHRSSSHQISRFTALDSIGSKQIGWYFESADRVQDSVIVRDAIGLRAYPVVGAEVHKVAVRQHEIAQDLANLSGYFIARFCIRQKAISQRLSIIKLRDLHLIGKNGIERWAVMLSTVS